MLCFLALIVFSLMGIFSASHRQLAFRALDCVFRRLTIRPCNTGFKEEVKGRLLGFLLRKSPASARALNNHFELLAWIFFVISLTSTIWVGRGAYNFYYYGSCNGLNQSGFCAFDPRGDSNKVSSAGAACSIHPKTSELLTIKDFKTELFSKLDFQSKNNIVFIGCFSCDYTIKVYPIIKKLVDDKKVNFTFAHYPINNDAKKLSAVDYCVSQQNKESSYWNFIDKMFSLSKLDLYDQNKVNEIVSSLGYDMNQYSSCLSATSTQLVTEERAKNIETTGLYGTPTVFVNEKPIVGPKPERVYRLMLK